MANNTAQKTRFNIFDVIIIFLVLASIGAIAARAYFTSNAKKDFVTAEVQFSVLSVSDQTANAIAEGQNVYLTADDSKIGVIGEIEVVPAELTLEDAAGKLVTLTHPAKKDIHGVASLSGVFTEDGFMIDGKYLAAAGKTVSVYTNGVECIFTVKTVSPNWH